MLKGSGVVDASLNLRRKLQADFAQVEAQTIGPNGLEQSAFTWEAWEWAFSMLFSRAINLRETEVGASTRISRLRRGQGRTTGSTTLQCASLAQDTDLQPMEI